jgi:hypothetical protein
MFALLIGIIYGCSNCDMFASWNNWGKVKLATEQHRFWANFFVFLVEDFDWFKKCMSFTKRFQVMWSVAQIRMFFQKRSESSDPWFDIFLKFFLKSWITRFWSFWKITWGLFVKLMHFLKPIKIFDGKSKKIVPESMLLCIHHFVCQQK